MKTARWVLLSVISLAASLAWADPLPDLIPLTIQVPAVLAAPPNPSVRVVCGVTNAGAGEASGYWVDSLYLSTNDFIGADAQFLTYQYPPYAIEPGETYWFTNQFTLQMTQPGRHYFILKCDAFASLEESDRSNNQVAVPFDFQPTPPDLAVLSLVVTSSIIATPYPSALVAWGVTNLGPGYAAGYWGDSLFLSSSQTLDETAIPLTSSSEWQTVPAGGVYWRTNTLQLPLVRSGTYYLFFDADHWRNLFDAQTNNNSAVAKITYTCEQPDLAPLALLAPSVLTGPPNPSLTLIWGVTNQGVGAGLGNWVDKVFLSTNAILESWDAPVYARSIYSPVAPGKTYWSTNDVSLPVVDSGSYYLIFQTDAPGGLVESDTNNNTLAVPISITIHRPDLVPLTRFPSEITGPPYPAVNLISGATNQGAGAALGNWSDFVFFSTNAAAGSQDALFNSWRYGPVASGESYWQTNSVRLPVVKDGVYYFTAVSDQFSNLYESDRSNNTVTVPVVVHILPPDLAPVALLTSTAVTSPPNPLLTFVWGITNKGTGSAVGYYSWYDSLYLSTNPVWDISAKLVGTIYESGPIEPGSSYWRTNGVRAPVVDSGTYYFFLRANDNANLVESDYSNNNIGTTIKLVIQPPDLAPVITGVQTSFVGPPRPNITLAWGVTNQGAGLAQLDLYGGWADAVYLSTDSNFDNNDVSLTSNWGGPLSPGATSWYTNTFAVPVTQSGSYYLIFVADRWNYLYESDKSNNIAVVPVTFAILPPDLSPLAFQVPTVITGSPNPSVRMVWGVTNQGIGPAQNGSYGWSDSVFFSRNAKLDPEDTALGSFSEPGPLKPGESYWRTNTVRLPLISSTNAYLIFKADSSGALYELNETNNTVVVPLNLNIQLPDLAPLALVTPNSITSPPLPTLTFAWGVTNQGPGVVEQRDYFWPWYDAIVISTSSNLDDPSTVVGTWSETVSLPAGGSYWRTNTCTLPVLQSGTYYLSFITDSSRTLIESDFTNNSLTVPMNIVIQPADLAPVLLDAPATVIAPPRPNLRVTWGVTNQGPGSALGYWRDILFLSSTPDFDSSATAIFYGDETGPREPGTTYWKTNTVNLPVIQSGTYYLFLWTDRGNSLYESDTNNNLVSTPINITILPPDLTPLAIQVTNLVIGPPYPSVSVVWGVTNQGTGAASLNGSWLDQVFLCGQSGSNCSFVADLYESSPVPAGGTYWYTNTFRMPVVESGTYLLRVQIDTYQNLYESSVTNNELAVPVTFEIYPPDLVPIALQAPTVIAGAAYPEVKISWGVTNQGTQSAIGNSYWADALYLSSSPVLDDNARYLFSTQEAGPVTPNGDYWRSQTVRFPSLEDGTYYLFLSVDTTHALYDGNYSNNIITRAITIDAPSPDLAPVVFQAPTTLSGRDLTNAVFVWGVTNQGTGPATTYSGYGWSDTVKLSTSPQGSWSDVLLFYANGPEPMPAGSSYLRTNVVQLPAIASGDYYFILSIDSGDGVQEICETNNTLSVPVTIQTALPDLAPIALGTTAPVPNSPYPPVSLFYAVTNQGMGLALGQYAWLDRLYLSRTNQLDGTEEYLTSMYQTATILPGDAYWQTNFVYLPVTESGSYYLLLATDLYQSLAESNETNNLLAIPLNVEIRPSDVAIIGLQASESLTGSIYPFTTVSWGITNQGPTAASGWRWYQAVFVSTIPALDSNAVYVTSIHLTNSLEPGSSMWFTNQLALSITTNGSYYLIVTANANNALCETNVANDVAMRPLTYSMVQPDLAPIALLCPTNLVVPPNPYLTLTWAVTNQGPVSAYVRFFSYPGAWFDTLCLSTSSNLDSNATWIMGLSESDPLAPGGSYWRTNAVRLPILHSGQYYLLFTANSSGYLAESDRSNNTLVLPLSVTVTPPDLKPFILEAPTLITGEPYPQIEVVWGVTNQGAGPAQLPDPTTTSSYVPLQDALYVSPTPALTSSQYTPSAAYWLRTNSIPAGSSYIQTNRVTLPISNSGDYFLIFRTDAYDAAAESDESNNDAVLPITVRLSPPIDLVVVNALAPRSLTGSESPSVTLTWQVMNQGFSPATRAWFDTVTLRAPMSVNVPLGRFPQAQPLDVGQSYWRTNVVTLPITHSGEYQLVFNTGTGADLFDLWPDDNSLAVPLTFTLAGSTPVTLSDPQAYPDGRFQLSVHGTLGQPYSLQASTDLLNWYRILDFVCTNNPTRVEDPGNAAALMRFYRVVPHPAFRLTPGPR